MSLDCLTGPHRHHGVDRKYGIDWFHRQHRIDWIRWLHGLNGLERLNRLYR